MSPAARAEWAAWASLTAPAWLFLAERLLPDGPARWVALLLVGASLAAALLVHGQAWRSAPASRALSLRLLAADAAMVAAVGAYVASRAAMSSRQETLAAVLLITALIIGLVAGLCLLAMVLAARSQKRTAIERGRVAEAAGAGLALALAIAALGLLNFAVDRTLWRIDLAHEAPGRPGEATLALVDASPEPLEVLLFFQAQSPVLRQVRDFFTELESRGVSVRQVDQELELELARSLKINRNGTIVVISGDRQENWHLGEDYQHARRRLRELDSAIHGLVARLVHSRRTVYITHEHGERPDRRAVAGEPDAARQFGELVRTLNSTVLYLGPSRLVREVPGDADLVVINGPAAVFLPAEVERLTEYLHAGGSLLVLLDPGRDVGLGSLLQAMDLQFHHEVLAHERDFYRDTDSIADRAFLFATSFADHPAMQTLAGVHRRAAVMFRRAGHLERRGAGAARLTMLVQSRSRTFADRDGDYAHDPETERQGIFDLAAAASVPNPAGSEGRALVIADADVFDDRLMSSEPNMQFAIDALLWLLRDEEFAAEVAVPAEVPIRHTRDRDLMWFYGSTFAAPMLVLLVGFGVSAGTRRRRPG